MIVKLVETDLVWKLASTVFGREWIFVLIDTIVKWLRFTVKSPESHLARSHVARDLSHVDRNLSHFARNLSHVARNFSYVTRKKKSSRPKKKY